MLRPEHLITLREVLRGGSFAAAANQLGYTPSAVSQQIAALERELGVSLFDRTARAIYPTEAAAVVARMGEAVITDVQGIMTVASQLRLASEPEVRLGCFPSVADLLVPRVLTRIGPAGRKALRIHIAESADLITRLGVGGDLSGAVVYQFGQSGASWPVSLSRRLLGEDPYVLAYPSVWGSTPSSPYRIEDFASPDWIFPLQGSSDATVIDSLFSRMELHPHVVARSDDYDVTLRLVAAGVAAAPLPRVSAFRGVPAGVEVLAPSWLNISRTILALWRPEAASTTLAECFASIRDQLEDLGQDHNA